MNKSSKKPIYPQIKYQKGKSKTLNPIITINNIQQSSTGGK